MILVAAGVYLSALVATGAVLFRLAFPRLPDHDRRRVARMGVFAAWAGVILILFQWPLEAGYLVCQLLPRRNRSFRGEVSWCFSARRSHMS